MTHTDPALGSSVAWRRVGLFYGIAFGGAVLVAAGIWALRQALGPAGPVVALAVTALIYMPLPMVAGLIVERVEHQPPLLAREWRVLRTNLWRTYWRNALVAVVLIGIILAVSLPVAWLAGTVRLPGAGHLASRDELGQQVVELAGGLPVSNLPPLAVLVVVIAVAGIVAGLTVNGLFALGEEYGWRGVLADELRPLGLWRATLLSGVLWGLWHAPIIMLGHNYGDQWRWGILVMVTWTVPLSYLLTWSRERTGSVLAPAMLHGACNGVLGVFTLIIVGGNVLISLPVGLLMALTLTLVALAVWRIPSHLAPRSDARAGNGQ